MLKFIFVVALVGAASASSLDVISPRGVVSGVQTCGGVGYFREMRLTGCTATPCPLTAGSRATIETDFTARDDCPELGLRLFVVLNDRIQYLVDVPIPGSSIIGGESYTIEDSLVPADTLRGESIEIVEHIYCTKNMQTELCVECAARVS